MPATKIQTLKRLLDNIDATLWVINASGRLVYLSAGVESWLGIDPNSLLDRICRAGTPISDEPLDQLAASLSPPPGLSERGTASLQLQPSLPTSANLAAGNSTPGNSTPGNSKPTKLPAREARFVRVGTGDDSVIIAVAGEFDDRETDTELHESAQLRQQLDRQRRKSGSAVSAVTAGTSTVTRRLRHRLSVAGSGRHDVLLVGNRGFCGDKIAMGLHQQSSSGEPVLSIDGGLMDVELLEASLSPVTMVLTESNSSEATAIVVGLDRMPIEAQERLAAMHMQFNGRLRLIATSRRVKELTGSGSSESHSASPESATQSIQNPIDPAIAVTEDFLVAQQSCLTASLVDLFCAQVIFVPPMTQRVEDIPLMATALLDHCHAHGETSAERMNRAALDALVIYPWPRDYREFDETIRSAARMTSGTVIGKEQLPLSVRSYRPGDPAARAKVTHVKLDDAVRRFESQLIEAAVASADGNRAEAARRLGISRSRLLRKLEEIDTSSDDD